MSRRAHLPSALAFAGVCALAFFLRMYRLDLIDFRFDQAFPLQYGQDIVNGHWWAAQPHGSVGAHPAMFLYALAVPYLFTRSFVAIAAYRIALDALAVPLVWLIGERYFNRRVGFVAALLFAVAPWPIQFARNLGVVVFPLGLALMLFGALETLTRKNSRGWVWLGWGATLVLGAHFSGLEALPFLLLVMALGRKTFRLRSALIGFLPLAFVAANFIAYDVPLGFQNIRAYLSGGGDAPHTAGAAAITLRMAAMMSGGLNLSDLTGAAFPLWQAQTPPLAPLLDQAQLLWLVLAFLFGGLVAVPGLIAKKQTALALVWVWMALPIALLALSSREPVLHYLLVILPAPFLLMALLADKVMRASRVAGVAMALVVGAVAIHQMNTTLRFENFVDTHDTTGGLGLPARGVLFARGQVQPGEVIAVIKDFPTPWNEEAAILRGALADVPRRFMNSESDGFVFGASNTQYIFAPSATPMLDRITAHAPPGAVITASLAGQAGSDARFVYARLTSPVDLSGFEDAPPAVFENGVTLRRVSMTYPAPEKLHLEVLLSVDKTPPEGADYHWYAHAFEGDVRMGQTDIAGVHPSTWRAGDQLVLVFDLTAPPIASGQPRYVRLGSYTFPEVKAVMATLPGKAPEGGVNLPLR